MKQKEGELLNWLISNKNWKPDELEQKFFFNLNLIEESKILLEEFQQQTLSKIQLKSDLDIFDSRYSSHIKLAKAVFLG
jgi:hypothetical protein